MSYASVQIWIVILLLGVGTFLIRFSFLGLIGDRPLPAFVLRMLRYTPVAVLPAMVAPLVIWPAATEGVFDPVRFAAAAMTVAVGVLTRHTLWAVAAGAVTLYGAMAVSALL